MIVPITGRPAGWCDHIARFWPVDAVVGENGAFTLYMQGGILKRLNTLSASTSTDLKAKLKKLHTAIVRRFPHAQVASDQAYREYDLAIDICEDVAAWSPSDVDALLSLCKNSGAHAKLSSIHVNTWFGDYDKRTGFDTWVKQGLLSKKVPSDAWIFIGDSPNDEPLFASFKHSVGVANLKQYLPRLKNPPVWITQKPSGQGFSQMAARLIRSTKKH